jgi:glyoxylase-like metal-dependent hydrolase (beta-lactamase superfamily II)
VIDPSVSADTIIDAVASEGAIIEKILLTHGHFDHIVSIDSLRRTADIKVLIHKDDAEMITDGAKNAFLTFFGRDCAYSPADDTFVGGDEISLGSEVIKIIHTPGHSKGSCCFLCDDFMITGDTLFSNNIGRCDLWGGDETALLSSLDTLSAYDRNIRIYPGHGPSEILGNALNNVAYFRM